VTVPALGNVQLQSSVATAFTEKVVTKGFQYRLSGTATWTTVHVVGDFKTNMTDLPTGMYEFRAFLETSTNSGTLYSCITNIVVVCDCD